MELINAELCLVERADAVVAVSNRELASIHQGVRSSKPSAVLGHSVNIIPTTKPFDSRRDLLFVGSIMDSPSPNEDTIVYFVNEIFPLIREHLDLKIWIVGTVLVDSVLKLNSESVVVTGRVDDLRPYFDQARLFVVPSRYAGGIPLKLVDAMAHGLPAVVSPLIATQMSVDERTVLIGDGPNEFAEQVVRLYKDENQWNVLRTAGLRLVQEEYSVETFKSRLERLLRDSKILREDSPHV
jgi:glycosyltransferase involved in cell wall biosynthesis